MATGRAWGLALGLGAAGGWLFSLIGMPLAWMMGAMAATTAAAISGLDVRVPNPLRALMIGVLGLMLGSAFTPAILDRLAAWTVSLSALAVYVVGATALVLLFLRRVAKYGPITAYFSAAPGGLNEMVLVGGAMGGDDRIISLSHALRILLIVFTVPVWFRLTEGYQPGGMAAAMGTLADVSAIDALVLGASAIIGALAARALRLPAANLTGPMVVSAGLHLAGLTTSQPPSELVALAQVVTGAAIGCRFTGIKARRLIGVFGAATGSTAIMLVLSIAAALALGAITPLPFTALLLAFVPGGLAEMCLIALALGSDVAFVSTHHFVRIVLVVMLAPLAFRLAKTAGWTGTEENE